jgi:hypothetical protein
MGKKISDDLRNRIGQLLHENAGKPKLDQLVSAETGVPSETIRSIRRQLGIRVSKGGRPRKEDQELIPQPADDLTRGDRILRLKEKIQHDPKYKILKETLDENEREMFMSEFINIAIDMETLDSFEESHLYTAIMNFVLGTRYARDYQQQREAYARFISSEFYGVPNLDASVVPRSMRMVPPNESLMEEFHKSTDTFNKIRDKFARIQEEKRKRIIWINRRRHLSISRRWLVRMMPS